MLKIIKSVFGSQADREYKKLSPIITEINAYVAQYAQLSDEQLLGKTAEFRALLTERTGSRTRELAAVETQLRGDLEGTSGSASTTATTSWEGKSSTPKPPSWTRS